MSGFSAGWRSERSRARAHGEPEREQPSTPAIVPPAARQRIGRGRTPATSAQAAPRDVLDVPWDRTSVFDGVRWTAAFAGFLYYMFVVTTYQLPGADIGMIVALVGLFFQGVRVRVPAMLAWLCAFAFWAMAGVLHSSFPALVTEASEVMLKLCLVVLVAVNVLRSRQQVRFFMVFFLGCYALYPTRGAIFNYLSGYTVWGRALWNNAYGNPNELAALTLLQLSMAVALLRRENGSWTWVRFSALAGAMLLPLLILLTQSRGAFLAMALFFLVWVGTQVRTARGWAGVAAICVVMAVAAPASVWERIGGLTKLGASKEQLAEVDREQSARQRVELLRVALTVARENAIAGVGVGAYPEAHYEYARRAEFDPIARGKRDAHNTILRTAAESGVVGLLCFLGVLGSTILTGERARRRLRAGGLRGAASQIFALELGLLSYMVAGMFGSFERLSFLYLHMALIIVLSRTSLAELDGADGQTDLPPSRRARLA